MDKATILIVDDERGPRESLRMILASDYRVLSSDNGVDALEILRSTPVSVITLDLNMPGMKGTELLRLVREEFPQTEVIVITGCGSIESAVDGIRHGVFDYLSKPFDVVQVTAAVRRALDRQASRGQLVDFLDGVGEVLGRDRDAEGMLEDLEANDVTRGRLRSVIQGAALNPSASRAPASSSKSVEFLEVLAETIENRDEYMRGHARRVAFYTGLLSERLCMSAEKRELIRISAFLHDLGKVGIPSEVASQASALLPAQRVQVEEHPDIGERLIRPLSFSGRIASGIRHHHERWDGGGYPDRLAGADIPLVARMIAIADAFDAMTCERPYRGRKSVDDAVHELNKHAGSQFDPHLVEEFVQIIESGVADCMEEDFGQPQTYSELRA